MKLGIDVSIATAQINQPGISPSFGCVFVYTSTGQLLQTINGLYVQVLQSYANN